MISVPDSPCPFKVGDVVYYRPSQRGLGLSANDKPDQNPKIGEAVRIIKIDNGAYLTVEGYSHPGGGTHWTEFSAN
jgi:hypothetical protein